MEDKIEFYEDRKGNFHSKKRKFGNNSEQTACSTPAKRRKTFNPDAPDSYSYNKEGSNFNKTRNNSYPSENYRNRNYITNESNSSQNLRNVRYSNKDSYSNENTHGLTKDRITNGLDEQEKDKKFSELIFYYKNVLDILKGGLPCEDTEIFFSNVLSESAGYEVKLSCDHFGSHCIELLLSRSKDPNVSRQFMAAFALEKEEVCMNPKASHCTELLLNIALQNIQNWSSVLNSEETHPDKENVSYFMSWISDFAEFIIGIFEPCLYNNYACHVVCSLIGALGGDMSSFTGSMSKKFVNHKKEFHNQYAGEELSKTGQYLVPVVLEDIPKCFKKILKKISKAFLKLDDIVDYVTKGSSAIVIETLFCILKKRYPEQCKKLISSLATRIFCERDDNNVPKAFLHRNCSFVVEKMFASADEELSFSLWNDYVVDSLEYLVTHSVGNYVIQRLFDDVKNIDQFELMIEKVGSKFEIIRSSGNYGIFISIAEACNRLKFQQSQFMKYIMQCLQCAEPKDEQIQLVPRILGFKVCDQPNISICLQGSLLVQAILKFLKPIKVVNSILNMKPQDLAFLASHIQGCHIFNAFFSSNSVGGKNKEKLIRSLEPCIVDIASDRNGSLTLSRIWMLFSLKQRSTMADILVEKEDILNNNSNGSCLLKKCGIFYYKRNIEKWREIQNNLSHSKKK